jgi:uncharacterized membrane protein YkvA (DUF1232 family)
MGYVLSDYELKAAKELIGILKAADPVIMEGEELAELARSMLEQPNVREMLEHAGVTYDEAQAFLPDDGQEQVLIEAPDGTSAMLGKEFFPVVTVFAQYGVVRTGGDRLRLLQKFFDWLFEVIESVLRKKPDLYGQVAEILEDADNIYRDFRERVLKAQKEHGDDQSFHLVLFVPDLFVYLCRIMADQEVDQKAKLELGIALVYMVSPIDLIPELVVPLPWGLFDDMGIVLYFLQRALHGGYIDREKMEELWPGDPEFIDNIAHYWDQMKEILGDNWEDILRKFNKNKKKRKA